MQGELVSTFSSSFHLRLPFSAFLPVRKVVGVNSIFCMGSSVGAAAAWRTDAQTLGRPGSASARGSSMPAGRAGAGRHLAGNAVAFVFFSFPAKKMPAF